MIMAIQQDIIIIIIIHIVNNNTIKFIHSTSLSRLFETLFITGAFQNKEHKKVWVTKKKYNNYVCS